MASDLTDPRIVFELQLQAAESISGLDVEDPSWLSVANTRLDYHEALLSLMEDELDATDSDQQAVYDVQSDKVEEMRNFARACGGSGYGSSLIWVRG